MLYLQAGTDHDRKSLAKTVRAKRVRSRYDRGFTNRCVWLLLFFLPLLLLLSGCAHPTPFGPRPFVFEHDTFAYPNELVWEYGFDSQGKWTTSRRDPPPTYYQHCFVVAKSARQFFFNACFDPALPIADSATYHRLIRKVANSNARRMLPPDRKIVIPGYRNLREFSHAQEAILKAECGGAWESYFQRGHWRMIFPFSRKHQARTVEDIRESINANRPAVLHVVRFPQLSINHAVMAFAWTPSTNGIDFSIYDPNEPDRPARLFYNSANRTFDMPYNAYFHGGRVDVYEVFKNWKY